MQALIGSGRLTPDEFWRLSVPDLFCVLGPLPDPPVAFRSTLARLMKEFPDG